MSEQREVNIAVSNHTYNLNPFTASYSSEAQLFTGLHEGLFSYDPVSLAPLPAICKSYKISRDKKRWTLTLRENAKFSDGSPIKANDVRDSFIRLLGTKGAPFASLIDNIAGAQEFREGKGKAEDVKIDVRDDYTIVIRLKEPMGHLPKILCHHSFSIVNPDAKVFSGPFVLEKIDGSEIILKKNNNYWDAEKVKIPGINFTISDDYPENSFKYNTGKLDWVSGNADFSKIINKSNLQMSAEFGTVYLFFKMQNYPWTQAEFRNALIEAIPYDELRKDFSIQAETLVNPLPGYPKVTGIGDWDPVDAKEMMKTARKRYGIGEDEKLQIVFAVITGDEHLKKWGELLKKAWEPLGVELTMQNTTVERYNISIPQWNADIFYYSWIGDFADPLAFLELFRGHSSLNYSKWKNDEYDNLLLESSRMDSIEEQYRLMSKAEQILIDDGMLIPVSHPVSAHLIDLETIGGWKANVLDIHPLKYLYIKEPPKKKIPNLVDYSL
ncbi:peptide ABC transporter substrate-binding protein [Treponema sp.]|uniref:peptide ABC transporter substrate-binding protein n=1 Tax=Treponema sp. TaxID=166 RepID=UPI0038902063